jgi:hypothetical protein
MLPKDMIYVADIGIHPDNSPEDELRSRTRGAKESTVFLANSEFAVISIHASRTNCRNPSIF